MKKTMIATLAVFGVTVLFSTGVLGADNLDGTTKGKIEYGVGHLVIDPLPEDPDKELPGGNFSNRLPNNLNFGYHPVQSQKAENWLARDVDTSKIDFADPEVFDDLAAEYGKSDPTVGNLAIEDNRGGDKGWSIKVKQMDKFTIANQTDTLGDTTLDIDLGEVSNNIGTIGITKGANKIVITPDAAEISVLDASAGNGAGLTQVPLSNFTLNIPANIDKEPAVYTADLNWTVSTTP